MTPPATPAAVLDALPAAAWMIDAAGRPLYANQVLCTALGLSRDEFVGADHYSRHLPPEAVAGFIEADRECLAQEGVHLSHTWLHMPDGERHLLEILRRRLVDGAGRSLGIVGMALDISGRVEQQRLRQLAHFDSLTGVPNRLMLADRMAQGLARARREQGLAAVCYIDLDDFKRINDRHGHAVGDRVLVEVSNRIGDAVREDDTVARLGGDEFVVLLVGLGVIEECVGSLQRLLQRIAQPMLIDDQELQISASIGVALYPDDEEDADTLLRHADQAMYLAKLAGKNRFHLFDPASDRRARSHHQLLQEIRQGLAGGEFELYYQPKLDLATRHLAGAEALIRWNHPQRGLLLPGEFMRAVENTELEIELGEWVVATAVEQLRRWREAGFRIPVSINISAYHFQSPGFVPRLREQAQRYGPEPGERWLQIEVLETAALDDIAGISALIAACRELGIGFALDDFGSGYSSLTYLSQLDVDTLKIDQSFVRDMQSDKGDHAVVQGIIALARAFDMHCVAEGVESEAIHQALLQMGCAVGQGNGIALPMPAADLPRWRPAP